MNTGTGRRLFVLLTLVLLLAACSIPGSTGGTTSSGVAHPTSTPVPTRQITPQVDTCPQLNGYPASITYCYTPHQFRVAYGVESLIERGFTGKGQTIVDIVSFGSPTLQQDMDVFDHQFNLPPINIRVISPIGTVQFDPSNKDMAGWAAETTLDVQIIHAIAPDAGIVVLTSPVSETEGTLGLPQFLDLEQYAIDHRWGNIISQSWGASEATLKDAAGQQEVQKWDAFFHQTTLQQNITFFASSGDNGATDVADLQSTRLSPTPTVGFPADDPWVTSVGGTSIVRLGATFQESAWDKSEGGFSAFFPTPSYQQTLPSSVQSQFKNRRGIPDVAGDADPLTGLVFYEAGEWNLAGGTSASSPLWSGLMAIADQMAGRSLGFINPAIYKLATSSHYAQDFRDITSGVNSVNERGVNITGYPAVQGWDPITGWGSPDAEKLLPDLIATMK